MSGPNLTEYQVEVIADRIRSGWTRRAIAVDMGLTRSQVERAAAGRGMASRPLVPHGRRHDTLRGPDLSWMERGRCVKVRGWDAAPVSVRKETCLVGGGCPVLDQCREHGVAVMSTGWSGGKADEGPVFGGLVGQELKLLRGLLAERRQTMARWQVPATVGAS